MRQKVWKRLQQGSRRTFRQRFLCAELPRQKEMHPQRLRQTRQPARWRRGRTPVWRSAVACLLPVQMRIDGRRDCYQDGRHEAGYHDWTILHFLNHLLRTICKAANEDPRRHVQPKQREAQRLHHVHQALIIVDERIWRQNLRQGKTKLISRYPAYRLAQTLAGGGSQECW